MRINELKNITKDASKKGFFNLLSANLLINIVAFASQLIVAKILMPEDIGRIKILQTYISIFTIIGNLGFASSTLKLSSENRGKDEIQKLFRYGLIYTGISTSILYILLLFLNKFNVFSSDNIIKIIFPLAMFPIITNSLFNVFISYFQGLKQIKQISNLTSSNKIIAIITIIFLTYFFGIDGYYIAYNTSFILMLIVCFIIVSKVGVFSRIYKKDFHTSLSKHWVYAKSSILALLLSEFIDYSDILLLNYFESNMSEVGFYGFALTLTVALRIIPGTVQQISTPYFSSKADNVSEFKKVYSKYFRMLILIIVGSLAIALILGPNLIRYIFDGKYNASIAFFVPLSIGWSIRQLNQLQSAALFGIGKIKYIVYAHLITIPFSFALIGLSYFYFGVMGLAYSSIISSTISVVCFYFFYKKAISTKNNMI